MPRRLRCAIRQARLPHLRRGCHATPALCWRHSHQDVPIDLPPLPPHTTTHPILLATCRREHLRQRGSQTCVKHSSETAVYPRARPVPCAPLALVVLLRTLSSAVPPPSAYPHIIEPVARSVKRERLTTTNRFIFHASAFAPHDSDGDQWRRPQLEHEPAGLISVLLAISRALSVCMRGRFAFVLPSFTEPRLIAFLSIHQLTLNLSIPFLSVPFAQAITTVTRSNRSTPSKSSWATQGQCMLAYIHLILEFMSQPGIVNEGHHIVDGLPPGSDRIIFDTHPYFAFDGAPNGSPIATSTDPFEAGGIWPPKRRLLSITRREQMERASVKQFALVPMDKTRDCFLMKKVRLFSIPLMDDDVQIGPALDGGIPSPLWSYQFGLQTGFMPTDPRHSVGICAALGVVKDPFDDVFSAGEAPATPLPTHIAAASIACLTFMTPVAGCTYPDTWKAIGSPLPAGVHGDAVSLVWTMHTWVRSVSRTFISCTFHYGLDGPSYLSLCRLLFPPYSTSVSLLSSISVSSSIHT
ncbi:hypothetical protein DFH08DRAFT_992784 [Mycena albidolilacea]|uniref:Uncharacterized protein n=1 Tax=Mycena albidolilacea TaxID=1033008 RepID=A0AAD7A7J6_9AGAR|nr:hypothetical protein DFH08DRAFT_992784 [Mycena albidolilacea]